MFKQCLQCKIDFEDKTKSHCSKFCTIKCRSAFKRPLHKKWKEKNEAKLAEYQANYYKDNLKHRKQQSKERKLKNKDTDRIWYREYKRNKYRNDPFYRLKSILRSRLSKLIKGEVSAVSDLGCTVEELKKYLESKFLPGMSWDNHSSRGWHIDHVIPLASANSEEELKKLCHYSNLQPLWSEDNLSKGSKNV